MSANRLLIQVAALGLASSVLFGVSQPFAHADTSSQSTSDFPAAPLADDVDWAAVQKALGGAPLEAAQGPTTFALGRIAARRGTSFLDVLKEVGEGASSRSLAADWVLKQAKDNDYAVDKTPVVGALAYFEKGAALSLGGPNVKSSGTLTLPFGHLAYVSAVNDDGTATLEDYGPYQGTGYQNYKLPIAAVTHFIHLGQTRVQGWISGAFEPSTPGVQRDIAQDPILGGADYSPQAMFDKYQNGDQTLSSYQQCGTYAEWWVTNRAGIDYLSLFEKTAVLKAKNRIGTEAGSAGRMDELYADLGVAVDKTPAVGAIATWDPGDSLLGNPFAADGPGHAAVVARVYRLNAADKSAADNLAKSTYPNTRKLKKLIDAAAASPGTPKLTYVLLEDYNGFGTALKYGQKLIPADLVKHYIHLAKSDVVKPATADDYLDQYLAQHPKLAALLGAQTGTEANGDKVKRTFANGAVTYDTVQREISYNPPSNATPEQLEAADNEQPPTTTAEPTARERLTAQAQRISDQLAKSKAKYAGKKQSTFMTDALAALTAELLKLQSKLAATVS